MTTPSPVDGERVVLGNVTVPSGAAEDMHRSWTIPAHIDAIQPVVDLVQQICREAGCSDRHCGLHIPVALSEALANAVAGGAAADDASGHNDGADSAAVLHVTLDVTRDTVTMTVRDHGAGFDLQRVQHSPADDDWLDREDGRGVFLMRSLMHHVESEMGPDGHTVRLRLHRT